MDEWVHVLKNSLFSLWVTVHLLLALCFSYECRRMCVSLSAHPISTLSIYTYNTIHPSFCTCIIQVAILNANYMAARLQDHYKVLFRGAHGE